MSLLGVVLAGGRSSRMGTNKAQLRWHGVPMLDRQVGLLKSSGCDAVVVSGPHVNGHHCIPDVRPFRGPVAALSTVVAKLSGLFCVAPGRMVVVPVDMPFLDAALIRQLATHAAPLLAYAGHPLPLAMRVDATSSAVLAHHAQHPSPSLQELWRMVPGAVWLPPENTAALGNANTPAEWEAIVRQERSSGRPS